MAQGRSDTQASLKRQIDDLRKQIYDVDLEVQKFRLQGNLIHIPNLEAAKLGVPEKGGGHRS